MKKTINWTIYNKHQLIIEIRRSIQNYFCLQRRITNFNNLEKYLRLKTKDHEIIYYRPHLPYKWQHICTKQF
ncbi:hypothetical protein D3C73_560190 [compost metagenome]